MKVPRDTKRMIGLQAELHSHLPPDAALGVKASESLLVENSPERHNVVVCTLCSCYPWAVLGVTPTWYKSFEYRARVLREPRQVLKEFGLELGDDVEVRVWDSTAEIRYMVLPERPAGTEKLSEEELAALVTRDSMVGTAKLSAPKGGDCAMDGVHDVGGMHGFGAVDTSLDEPLSKTSWRARMFGIELS